jgi:hypothetical protein
MKSPHVLLLFVLLILAATGVGFAQCCDSEPTNCPNGYGWSEVYCRCVANSPIILDLDGDGVALTDAANGVLFTFGISEIKVAWTAPGSDDAFLALDRNHNGVIDDASELFGNFSPQSPSENPNGFAALAVYDLPENGGSGDGQIDVHDRIFSELRLWRDANHNGRTDLGELLTLSEVGVSTISLDYSESQKRDRYGNVFRLRAKVTGEAGHWAYDVFLTTP